MLSREDNETLTRVGPGTLMGNLLRRYWIPACLTVELPDPDGPPVRVRLLGEDLVAFRDTAGAVGLIEEQCPHRGASLFYGRNEECGLRCTYHGWKFDVTGQCTDQRSELHPFAWTAHISNLHQFDAIDDVPDDGSDRPGYPSGYMSMKFWRHDPRPGSVSL